jgi:DNA polymerase-3 subunit alpha
MLVFNSAYASNADKITGDRVLIVRGRVDHKEAGETKLVVQDVEVFEPSREEVEDAKREAAAMAAAPPKRITLHVPAGVSEHFLDELRDVVHHNRGDHELLLCIGERSLLLGNEYKVSASSECRTELAALTGVRIAA